MANLLGVPRKLRHIAEAARQAIKQLRVECACRSRQFVVHPLSLASNVHESRFAEIRKMARNLWLRKAKHIDDVADTKLARSK
jgi:hypothetical protein